jgi:hypothetical protein
VADFYEQHKDPGLELVAELWPVSRDETGDRRIRIPDGATEETAQAVEKLIGSLMRQTDVLGMWIDRAQLQRDFSAAQGEGGAQWLRTQTVVVSRPGRSSVMTTGGTNADSKVTPFQADESIPRGAPRLTDEGVVRFHPQDKARLDGLSRLAVRERFHPHVEQLLAQRMAQNPGGTLDPRSVLIHSSRVATGIRGFSSQQHLPPRGAEGAPPREPPPPPGSPPAEPPSCERPPGRPGGPSAEASRFFAVAARGLYLEKEGPTVRIVRRTKSGAEVAETWDADALSHAVLAEMQNGGRHSDRGPVELAFGKGFSPDDAQAVLKTLRVQARRFPEARPAVVYRDSPAMQARLREHVRRVVPQTFDVQLRESDVHIAGSLTVQTPSSEGIIMRFRVELDAGPSPVTAAGVNDAVRATARAAELRGDVSLRDLGTELIQDILNYSGRPRAANAEINLAEIGDFYIVLELDAEAGQYDALDLPGATLLAAH